METAEKKPEKKYDPETSRKLASSLKPRRSHTYSYVNGNGGIKPMVENTSKRTDGERNKQLLDAFKENCLRVFDKRIDNNEEVALEKLEEFKKGAKDELRLTLKDGFLDIPKKICSDIYVEVTEAMANSDNADYVHALDKLGESDLVVAIAFGHSKKENAVMAAEIIAKDCANRVRDLEFLLESEHDEVGTIAEEALKRYYFGPSKKD